MGRQADQSKSTVPIRPETGGDAPRLENAGTQMLTDILQCKHEPQILSSRPAHPTHQEVLVDLEVAIIVGQVGGAVQRSEPLVVTLVHLRPIVQQVVHLGSEEGRCCEEEVDRGQREADAEHQQWVKALPL